jgi:hypothetical protein
MPVKLPRLLALAATGLLATGGGLAVASCSDEKSTVDVAEAAASTADKGTARISVRLRMQGLGAPSPLVLEANGVTALAEPRARLTVDIGPLLALGGPPPAGDQNLELTVDGPDLYAKPPPLPGLTIPGGKQWVALDLKELAESAGLPTRGLGALLSLDPASELRALKAGKKLKKVGEEEVDGVPTTHFKGVYRISDVIPGLPAEERADARKGLKALERLLGPNASLNAPSHAEVWADEDDIARRMTDTTKVPAAGGVPAGSFSITYSLHDFGTPLDTTGPPESEVHDATDNLKEAVKDGGQGP